jgi:uncharacterized protein YoxC
MKKIALLLVCLVLFVGFVYSIPTDEQIQQAADTLGVPIDGLRQFVQSYQMRSAPSDSIQIEAKKLMEEYRGNQLKADIQYKDKTLQITGKVKQVKKNWSNEYYIEVEGDSIVYTVDVYVQSSELSKIGNLNSGQTITVVGICKGFNIYSVEIKDAYLAK